MELNELRMFEAVYRCGSFSEAANQLFVSQPTASATIKKLEENLGTKVFVRLSGGLKLTEAGEILLSYSQKILSLVDDSRRAIVENKTLHGNKLRIGASSIPGTYYLPKLLAQYRRDSTNVEINLKVGTSEEIRDLVLGGELDLGIIGYEYAHNKSQVVYEHLWTDPLSLILPLKHPLAQSDYINYQSIAHQKFIIGEAGSSIRKIVEDSFRREGVPLDIVMECKTVEGILVAVSNQLGISIVPQRVLNLNANNLVLQREISEMNTLARFGIIYQQDKELNQATHTFRRFLKRHVEKFTKISMERAG